MKKLIFTFLLAAAGTITFAQQLVSPHPLHKADGALPAARKATSFGKVDVSSWYDPIDWLSALTGGANVQTFVDFLMKDSIARYIDENDTTRRFYSISVGQVVDPKDDVIDQTTDPDIKMTVGMQYTIDSFYLNYLYVRNVDSLPDGVGGMIPVVDTLIVNYFTTPQMSKSTQPLGTAPNQFHYMKPNWSIPQLMPTSPIATQIITLTRDDSTTARNNDGKFENAWALKTMVKAAPAGLNVASNRVSAITFSFKPGMPYDSNSVMIYQRDPSTFTGTRVNYFGYRFSQNSGTTQWRSTKFFNHSLFSDKENAYYPSNADINNGWNGYIPGNAYFTGRHVWAGFHLTSMNTDVKEINNDVFAMSSVYPNPSRTGETALLSFNLKNNSTVTIEMYSLLGQLVKSDSDKFAAGQNKVNLDLSGMKPGIYMVNMTVNGVTSTKKLTIIE